MASALLLVLIAAVLVVFSVQNGSEVALSFLVWRFTVQVATLVIGSVLTGIIVAQLLRRVMVKRQEQARNTVEFISRRRI